MTAQPASTRNLCWRLTYVQALRGETDELQAVSNESEEDLLNTLDIAGKMRKRLQKCDEEFACHETSFLVKSATETQPSTAVTITPLCQKFTPSTACNNSQILA